MSSHWLWYVYCSDKVLDITDNLYRNFVVQMATPVALANIKYKYYLVYTATGLTYIGSVYFFYPETMGQSLEKLEDLFQQALSIFETVRLSGKSSAMKGRGWSARGAQRSNGADKRHPQSVGVDVGDFCRIHGWLVPSS